MKALRFYGSKDLRVENVAAPKICGPRQVIVKVAWCGICGTDLHEYVTGPIFMPRQQILGHEFSGTVVEMGSELKDYREGDRVTVQPRLTPGNDYYSVRGLSHLSERLPLLESEIGLGEEWASMRCSMITTSSICLTRFQTNKELSLSLRL